MYEAPNSAPVKELVASGAIVTFTSASTVRGFVQSLPDTDFSGMVGCCIGRQTAAEAEKYGIPIRPPRQAPAAPLLASPIGGC